MSMQSISTLRSAFARGIIDLVPGIALSAAVAAAAYFGSSLLAAFAAIPAMVIALLVGIPLNPIASGPLFKPGIHFCVRVILRWAVALLGLRIALSDIAALGPQTALIVLASMTITIAFGLLIARWTSQQQGFGALAGVATGVCGASATLAVSAVIPHYANKQTDIVFVVIAVNALSTVAMLAYPLLCSLLAMDPQSSGILLGATIHDVAQVVGSGYSISNEVGNTAVIVKLFRVFMLLPIVLCIGWYFSRRQMQETTSQFPFPMFAVAFLLLCLVNSAASQFPAVQPLFGPVKAFLSQMSNWGLLIAIAALGLETSLKAISTVTIRHLLTIVSTTLVLLAVVTALLWMLPASKPSTKTTAATAAFTTTR